MFELTKKLQDIRDDIPEAISGAIVDVVGVVVDESPKLSGQLRASTRIGFNSPDLQKVTAEVYAPNAVQDPEQISKGRAEAVAGRYSKGDTIYISNDHYYAAEQEYGAGHLMFTKGAKSFPYLLDKNLNAIK